MIQRRLPLLFLLFRVRERRRAGGFSDNSSGSRKTDRPRFHEFAICLATRMINVYSSLLFLAGEFTAERLASKTINSRLAQNDELERDNG